MCRPRRVRVSAALSAGGGGGPAELVSAAVASRSPMSEPPDALDRSTQRLLPVCVIGTMASPLERNEMATEMNDASNLYGCPIRDPDPRHVLGTRIGYALGHGRGIPHLPWAARRMRVFLDAPVG
jgi:hypothetical protein